MRSRNKPHATASHLDPMLELPMCVRNLPSTLSRMHGKYSTPMRIRSASAVFCPSGLPFFESFHSSPLARLVCHPSVRTRCSMPIWTIQPAHSMFDNTWSRAAHLCKRVCWPRANRLVTWMCTCRNDLLPSRKGVNESLDQK